MWSKVVLLLNSANKQNCEPGLKTVNFLKKNLMYCFDPALRSQLKDSIERFEAEFFQGKFSDKGVQDKSSQSGQKGKDGKERKHKAEWVKREKAAK